MLVRHIMQKDLVTVLPTASIYDVSRKMKEFKIGSVLIVEEGWKLLGIVTDRDIALAVGADLKDPKLTYASDIMISDPITINADANLDSALRIMNRANIRRLPVNHEGKLVGLLSSADVATEIKEEFNQFIGLEEAFARH